jgi:hypothetical protein
MCIYGLDVNGKLFYPYGYSKDGTEIILLRTSDGEVRVPATMLHAAIKHLAYEMEASCLAKQAAHWPNMPTVEGLDVPLLCQPVASRHHTA